MCSVYNNVICVIYFWMLKLWMVTEPASRVFEEMSECTNIHLITTNDGMIDGPLVWWDSVLVCMDIELIVGPSACDKAVTVSEQHNCAGLI